MGSWLDDPARRYGLLAGGLALAGFVALNAVPLAGTFTVVALAGWVTAWAGTGYVASVAHRLARWAAIGDDPGVDRLDDGRLAAYATTAGGRRVTMTATRHGRVRPRFGLVAETTLGETGSAPGGKPAAMLSVDRDGVRPVEGDADEAVRAAVAGLTGRGRLLIDGDVVRFESAGLLDGAEEFHERAATLARVAAAVEESPENDKRVATD